MLNYNIFINVKIFFFNSHCQLHTFGVSQILLLSHIPSVLHHNYTYGIVHSFYSLLFLLILLQTKMRINKIWNLNITWKYHLIKFYIQLKTWFFVLSKKSPSSSYLSHFLLLKIGTLSTLDSALATFNKGLSSFILSFNSFNFYSLFDFGWRRPGSGAGGAFLPYLFKI